MSAEDRWSMDAPPWRGGRRDATTGLTHWRIEGGQLSLDVGPADWRNYRTLRLQLTSPKATGARVRLDILGCEEELLGHIVFPVDWVGANEMQLPLADFEPQDDEERWHLVHALRLSCEQPGSEPTELILGAVAVTAEPSV